MIRVSIVELLVGEINRVIQSLPSHPKLQRNLVIWAKFYKLSQIGWHWYSHSSSVRKNIWDAFDYNKAESDPFSMMFDNKDNLGVELFVSKTCCSAFLDFKHRSFGIWARHFHSPWSHECVELQKQNQIWMQNYQKFMYSMQQRNSNLMYP